MERHDLHALIGKAARQPLLGRDEERLLARRAGAGDAEATQRLVVSHLLFVVRLARRYRGSGLPMGDLVQEGVVGLLKAICRFDPDQGVRFSTYAGWWVRSAMQDYAVRSWSLVRVGTTNAQKALFLRLRQMVSGAEDLSDDLVAALARRFDVTRAEVATLARRLAGGDLAPEGAAENLPAEGPDPEQAADGTRVRGLLEKALQALPPREQLVIRRRYLEEVRQTFEAIGRELGLSKDRARQLEAKALARLRETLRPALLAE